MSRRPFAPTEEQRNNVELMIGFGLTESEVSDASDSRPKAGERGAVLMPIGLSNPQEAAFYRIVGANVRRARELGDLKQGQVADTMKIDGPRMSRLEAGLCGVTAVEFFRIVQVLDVSTDCLTDGLVELAEEARLARQPLDRHGRRVCLDGTLRPGDPDVRHAAA